MATVAELIKQYETDPKLQKEVENILADGKITINEFRTLVRKPGMIYGKEQLLHRLFKK